MPLRKLVFSWIGMKVDPPETGLQLLNPEVDDPNQDILADIVAVHGLGGHARKSWTSSDEGYFWLDDIAKTKYLGNNVRVFTYGYDATIAFGRSIGNLTQHADMLLDSLNGQRSNERAVRRPIVFIGHSLGGIVVKKALLNAHNNRAAYGKLFESVYGIMFLGTPHQGSDAAIAGTKVIKTVSFGSRRKPSSLLKSLRTNSEALETISNDFQHHVSGDLRKVQKIVSFYEQMSTARFGSVIVTRNSAVLHLAGDIESQVPLAVDHAGLCKFPNANDQSFRTVSRHIERLVEGARIRHEDTLAREYDDLGKRLHKVHYEAHHEEILARKCENTLKWVIQHQTYIGWKEYRRSRILWLNGEVGSGKTMTAASLINELQEECKAIFGPGHRPLVLYFFCDGKETAKSDPSNVLEALLHQVLVQRPSTGHEIDRQIRKAEKQFSLTVTNGIKILQQALSNIPQAYIILDAIDECGGEKAALLSGLFGIVKESRSINLLVTTRPHPGDDLNTVIQQFFDKNYPIARMTLAEEYVSKDIEHYLSQKLAEFPRIKHLDSGLKDRVRNTILLQASGIFLWASLAWEMFSNFSDEWTVKGVEKRLEMLHGLGRDTRGQSSQHRSNSTSGKEASLYGFYDAILDRIPARQRESSKKLFRFLVFAQTPLNLDDLKVAYALHENHLSSESLQEDLPVGDFEDEVKSKCCPFIKIVGANQTVKLVHQSIKEFFLDGDHKDYCFTLEQDRAHLDISISCLTFLCFSDFSKVSSLLDPTKEAEEDFRRLEAYPFLKYSALYWAHHAIQVGNHPQLWDIFLRFSRSGASMNLAFRILWYSGGRGPFPQNTSPMHVLCFLGLGKLVKDAFKVATTHSLDWATADTPDCIGRTPLHWAAINGHADVIDALLEEGADTQVKAPADEGSDLTCTPLDFAVEYGHLNATKLLLKGARSLVEHDRLLEMAAARGHTELVKVIFSLDSTSDLGPTLHAAVYGDHMDTVKYLLRLGARVDSNNQQHGTPLHVATFEGNLDMVRLLLAEGADPNAQGGVHGTALQAAAYRNSQDIAIELLQRGADINARGGQHGSPLEAALFIGQMKMVEILRDHGAVSRADAIVRRASVIDEASAIAIQMVEKEIVKGRLGGIEKRSVKFNKDFLKAVESGNLRTVEVMLNVGLKFFKFAVKSDSEGFLVFIVKTAMQLLQTAVKNEFHQGVETLTKLYAKALAFALAERGPALVARLLQECLKEFNTLVEGGKDGDAENLVVAGIEILVTVSGAGNKDLMQVMAEKWIQAFENLINGRFERNLIQIIDGYASRWINAVERHDTARVTAWGTTAAEALSTATLGKQKRVAKLLSDLFSQRFQEVFDHESNELGVWLFNTCQWEFSQVDMSTIHNDQVTRIWKFALDFLLATESTGRRKRDCQASQERILRLGTSFFNAVKSSGFLDLLAEITRKVMNEKFSDCVDKTHVLLLVGDISRVIDTINTLYQDTELESVMSIVQTDLKSTAGQIIASRWG